VSDPRFIVVSKFAGGVRILGFTSEPEKVMELVSNCRPGETSVFSRLWSGWDLEELNKDLDE